MAKAFYRNTGTNQMVFVPVGFFAGNPLWELVEGGGGGGDVTQAELDALEQDTTGPHGVADFSLLETQDSATHRVSDGIADHSADVDPHGDRADTTLKVATHAAASDPHADRAFTTSSITTHNADPTGVHGISDTQQLETITGSAGKVTVHAGASDPHGDRADTTSKIATHAADTTAVHGITDTALLSLKGELVLNVKDFGAVGDNIATDTPAIAAAMAAAVTAGGGVVYFPPGVYKVTTALTLSSHLILRGAGGTASRIHNAATDLFTSDGAGVSHLTVQDLYLSTSAGHIFAPGAGGIFQSVFERLILAVSSQSTSIYTSTSTFIDNIVTSCALVGTLTHTVPLWQCVSTGGNANRNLFQNLRVNDTGNYAFWFEETQAASYTYDNVWIGVNFERCNGGHIKILGGNSTLIQDCPAWDLTTTTQDLYYIGKSAAGSPSRLTAFKQVNRRGGTLGGGLVDVRLQGTNSAPLVLFEQMATATGGLTIDVGANSGVKFIGCHSGTTVQNPATGFVAGNTVADTAIAGVVSETTGIGSPETVITAPPGSRYSRTDGGAGTAQYIKESGSSNTGWVTVGTSSTLAAKVDKGELVINVKDAPYNAAGNGTGDDSVAINAAIAAVQVYGGRNGGEVYLPPGTYRCTNPINLAAGVVPGHPETSVYNVHLRGGGGRTAGAGAATILQYSGADAANFINAQSAIGVIVSDMMVLHTASFTGRLIDLRYIYGGSGTSGTAYCTLKDLYLGGVGNTAVGVDLDGTTRITIDRVAFYSFAVCIRGVVSAPTPSTSFSNQVTIRDCGFNTSTAAIRNPGSCWFISGGCFEGSGSGGAANAIDHDAGVYAEQLTVIGCWLGDSTGGTQFRLAGRGLTIIGNWIGNTNGTGIHIDEAATGLVVTNNTFAGSTTAINMAAASTGEHIRGNQYTTVATRLAGTLSSGATYGDHATLPATTVNNPLARPILAYKRTAEVDTNVSLNGSFDTDTANWNTTSFALLVGGSTLTRITTDAAPLSDPAAQAVAQVDYDNSSGLRGIWEQVTGQTASTIYYGTAWVKAVSGRPVKLSLRDSTNVVLATSGSATVGAGWTKLYAQVTTGGSGPVTIQVAVGTDSTTANGQFLVDEVRLGSVVVAENRIQLLHRRLLAAIGAVTDQTIA